MKAAVAQQYGGLENVAVTDVPMPKIGPDEVLVRVETASVNPLDVKLTSGGMRKVFPLPLPFTAGTDLAGTVIETGLLAAAYWKAGDRVFARLEPAPGPGSQYGRTGAFAEFAAVPALHLARVPDGMDLALCAGLPTAAGTAWQALFETARLRAGETVLVHAGAGGVGGFSVQIARIAGARVIATASAENLEYVRGLGAEAVLDYRT